MNAVGTLRYDQVAFKASHNSIDRRWSIADQLSGASDLVEPCRAIELDLVQAADRFEWTVAHGVTDDGPPLETVLRQISAWAGKAQNRRHPVVTVHLDLKNAHGTLTGFATAIDKLLVDEFGKQRLYRPAEVIGDHPDLVRGARAGGWATFEKLRGRFVFCLSGHAKRKARYARHRPRERVCFADNAGSKGAPRKGHRVFANLFVEATGYKANLNRVKRHPGFIARGYNIVIRKTWDRSVNGSANILSSDVLDSTDLSLGGDGFAPAGGA
ncbi:MAG: Ca2+-dependent phosphoinositide-specific phospholipase C [Gemmatimonadota bacterium]|nr:Ca2+-dependent phosphoinositide-specific phospholipase C [Gemmatimonadota bacterium]